MHKVLEGSLVIRCFIALNSWLGAQLRDSLVVSAPKHAFAFFGRLFQNTLIATGARAVHSWFGRGWQNSAIIGRFLSPGSGEGMSEGSVFTRLWLWFHRGLCTVFEKLRINKLLRGSIFTMPYIWSMAVIALAPVLPTMLVATLTIIATVSLVIAFGCDRGRKLAYSPINKFVLLYAIVYIGATFTSVTVSGSLSSGLLTTLFVLFAIVLQNSVTTRRQLHALVYAFVLCGAAVSIYGIYQYVFGTVGATAWLDSTMFSDFGVRVYSTLDNPNILSMYLLLVMPFAGASLLLVKGFFQKVLFVGCLGVMAICMVLTYARGGWLGLVVAAVVFFVMLDKRFILVGIAALIILYFALPDVILDRFLSIGDVSDSSTSYRVYIWMASIAMLRDYWFTGIGPGTAAFNRIYPVYSFNTVAAPHTHNLFLQIMCDTGISGVVVFLCILFTYFRGLCSAVSQEGNTTGEERERKKSKILQIASISSVLGFLVQGMGDYSFYNYRVALVFWAVLGIGVLAARRSSLQRGGRDLI